ncbi:MAG TPA: ABC transporter ATP-binding protein [Gaiellaceae bacterium]|nr:ABC transporter ATP-binding protein [Gaiellaceae bacterium]
MAARPDDVVLRVERLTKRFGDVVAVDDLSFTVGHGTVTGFLGPNGAGKTTTLRVLLGLAAPTSGSATVLGVPYRRLADAPHRVGAVLEVTDFNPGRTGRDHLRTLALSAGIPTTRVAEVLSLVELSNVARKRVKGYSLGMRQRLGLAASLLGEPDVLVLDEPANGLDPEGVRWLRDFLRAFVADGRTVFVSSHVLAEVAQTVDRVVIINDGKLVTATSLQDLTRRSTQTVRVRTPEPTRLAEVLSAAGLEAAPLGDDRLSVARSSSAEVGELAAANGIPLHELVGETPSLEDIFLSITGRGRP